METSAQKCKGTVSNSVVSFWHNYLHLFCIVIVLKNNTHMRFKLV